jgi:hypothetical protein
MEEGLSGMMGFFKELFLEVFLFLRVGFPQGEGKCGF